MNFLKVPAKRKVKTFAILGLGIFGSTVAKELMNFGNHVIGLDSDEERVLAHANQLTRALIVDVRDEAALREAGLDGCEMALVAVGENLESSVLAAINLKTIGVKVVWAKASHKTHHRILSKLNVDRVIHPEEEVGQQIAQVLHNPTVRDYVSLGNGYHVVNYQVPEQFAGRSLAELNHLEFDLRCIGAMRGTEFLGCDGDVFEIRKDDRIILLGKRSALRAFASH